MSMMFLLLSKCKEDVACASQLADTQLTKCTQSTGITRNSPFRRPQALCPRAESPVKRKSMSYMISLIRHVLVTKWK